MPKPSADQVAKYESISWWPQEWQESPAPAPEPPQHTAEIAEAFKSWAPEPEAAPAPMGDDDENPTEDPIALALTLLEGIAEERYICARFRTRARRYFRDLKKAKARAAAAALADAAD